MCDTPAFRGPRRQRQTIDEHPFMSSVREQAGTVFVPPATMRGLVTAIFRRAGCNEREASSIGTRLTGASLRGHDSHGVIRTARYVEWLEDGKVFANREVTVLSDTANIAILDGNYGFGQSVGERAVDIGVDKALATGVGVTALRNAGHLGRIGDWAERAAERNVVSLHLVNVRGSLLVAPFGGIDRRAGTSPFCAGIPLPGEPPVILDFATSLVAEGKALVAMQGGKPLPAGSLVDADGTLTSDPRPLYGEVEPGRSPDPSKGPGALTGFGLHKGSGLNFLMEMLAGALTGSGTAGALGEPSLRRFCNGMLSIYLDVARFHSDDAFAREVRSYIAFVKSSRPTEPGGQVLVPGEKERALMAEREATGLPLTPATWADILGAARRVGLSEAEIEAALA